VLRPGELVQVFFDLKRAKAQPKTESALLRPAQIAGMLASCCSTLLWDANLIGGGEHDRRADTRGERDGSCHHTAA